MSAYCWNSELSWEKENTARKQSRFGKPKKEMAFIRRFADDTFRHSSTTLNPSMWDTSEESDPFDLPTPQTMYSLNKKGRWNCVQRLRKVADSHAPGVNVIALEKFSHPAHWPSTPASERYTAAVHEYDEMMGEKHRFARKCAAQERSLRSASADGHKSFVRYEIVKTHPSSALWSNFAKENARLAKVFGRSGGSRARKAKQLIEKPSEEELKVLAATEMTMTAGSEGKGSPEAPTQRKPLVIPLVDCIRLKPSHANNKNKTKKNNGNRSTNGAKGGKKAVEDWEVVADDAQPQFDGDWELV